MNDLTIVISVPNEVSAISPGSVTVFMGGQLQLF